jgi:cell division protein FtsB
MIDLTEQEKKEWEELHRQRQRLMAEVASLDTHRKELMASAFARAIRGVEWEIQDWGSDDWCLTPRLGEEVLVKLGKELFQLGWNGDFFIQGQDGYCMRVEYAGPDSLQLIPLVPLGTIEGEKMIGKKLRLNVDLAPWVEKRKQNQLKYLRDSIETLEKEIRNLEK